MLFLSVQATGLVYLARSGRESVLSAGCAGTDDRPGSGSLLLTVFFQGAGEKRHASRFWAHLQVPWSQSDETSRWDAWKTVFIAMMHKSQCAVPDEGFNDESASWPT
jgi:hypothetical protein